VRFFSKLCLIDNLQFYNLLLSCVELTLLIQGTAQCTLTDLPIPYVLPDRGEYLSTR